MGVTSTWSLVGTHPESNLGHHNDRWMVTYPARPLSQMPVASRAMASATPISLLTLRDGAARARACAGRRRF